MNKLDIYKKELVKVLASIKDEATMNEFLADLLTGAEIEELPKRLQIIKQLDKGVSQREVAKNLGVGIATVTRGAKELKNKKGGFRKILDLLSRKWKFSPYEGEMTRTKWMTEGVVLHHKIFSC